MKKKAVIAAAVFAAAMNLSACAYGPPTENYEDMPRTEGTTSFDPEENQNAGVYGPPETEELEYEETDIPEEEQEVGEDTLNNE